MTQDGLGKYMKDPSMELGLKYIQTRASGLGRYFLERGAQLLCSWIPGPIGVGIRAAIYHRLFGQKSQTAFVEAGVEFFFMNAIHFGKGVYVDSHCRLHGSSAEIILGNNNRVMRGAYLCSYVSNARSGEGIVTGDDCWIGVNAVLASGQGGLHIGDNVLIGPNAVIVTGNHDYERVDLTAVEQNYYGIPIHIGNNAWIGANSTVLGGATIGDHSVIAAGAVVSGNVPPYTVAGGVPARVIREIQKN